MSSEKETPGLVLENVTFRWPSGNLALDKCNFSIPGPGLWMLVGSNGTGKSTLFRLICGTLTPQNGNIHCSLRPALMFQNPDHQLLLPSCGSDLLLNIPQNLSFSEKCARVQLALEQVGLAGMERRPIHTLSGGQKQRLALAGALVSDAQLLLLDEPTALLDPSSQQAVIEIVKNLCQRKKNPITALWITHRLQELRHCQGAAMMESGRVGRWFSSQETLRRLNSLAVRRV